MVVGNAAILVGRMMKELTVPGEIHMAAMIGDNTRSQPAVATARCQVTGNIRKGPVITCRIARGYQRADTGKLQAQAGDILPALAAF